QLYSLPALLLVLLLAGCGGTAGAPMKASLGAVEAVNADDSAGYERVTAPRPFSFPQGHRPHQPDQTERGCYTRHLEDQGGRHFGFQMTFFRRALVAQPAERASDLAVRNIYMAHLALSDVGGGAFFAFDRFSRDGGNLAGAGGDPYRVWLEDWYAAGEG